MSFITMHHIKLNHSTIKSISLIAHILYIVWKIVAIKIFEYIFFHIMYHRIVKEKCAKNAITLSQNIINVGSKNMYKINSIVARMSVVIYKLFSLFNHKSHENLINSSIHACRKIVIIGLWFTKYMYIL